MTVLEYLKTNKEINFQSTALEVFVEYEAAYPGVAKFEYFRTKYNNYRKENNIKTEVKLEESPHKHKHHKVELEVDNYTDTDLSGEIAETIPTGTLFDTIVSDGGFVRKSVDAVAAKAGSGKTWSRMSLLAEAVIYNRKAIEEQKEFISNYPEEPVVEIKPIKAALLSAEMVKHEIAKEVLSSPKLRNIDFIYLVNYFKKGITAEQYWDLLEECFKNYDLLIADSFSIIFEQLFELYEGKIKAKKLLFLLISRLTEWTEKYNCNLQLILQCKRDGTYLGASALVHAISSLSYVYVYGQKRFIMFEKNRNNGRSVNQEIFFSKKDGDLIFDEDAYNNTYNITEDKKSSMADFIIELQQKNIVKLASEKDIHFQTNLIDSIAEIELNKEENNDIATENVTKEEESSHLVV